LEYLEKLVGKARQATADAAEKMVREAEEAEENDGELGFLSVFCQTKFSFLLFLLQSFLSVL